MAGGNLLPGYLDADLIGIGAPESGYLIELPVHRGEPVVRISDQAEYTPPVIYSRAESQRLVFLVA